jgi:hypothetical protein
MHVMAVRHTLTEHPLLQLPELVKLAKRSIETGEVRHHDDSAAPDTNFILAHQTHPVNRPADEIVANIESARAWLSLHNIQKDPVYRELVDEVLDVIEPMIRDVDPGMHNRSGWIFVTSPGAVTPYHMDHEHNFILQIRGEKEIHVFPPLDRSIVSERALELFHRHGSRELVVYDDAFEKNAEVFHAKPGMGAYMPTTSPHWVKNGDGVSITVSFTYYTRETRRRERLHTANHLIRLLGASPSPVGASAWRDAGKNSLMRVGMPLLDALPGARTRV